jgi:hypothetical protein
MNKKVVDIAAYRIEKTLQKSGFAVKKDKNKKIKLLIKISAR